MSVPRSFAGLALGDESVVSTPLDHREALA
jgi:hypothetical protein